MVEKVYIAPDIEAGYKALQIQGIFCPGAKAEENWRKILYYENGSFDLEAHIILALGESSRIVSQRSHSDPAYLWKSLLF